MTHWLKINYRHLSPSDALDDRIKALADKLARMADHRIQSMNVIIEAPNKPHTSGHPFRVHLDFQMPGKHMAVSHDPGNKNAHDDVYVALRDAFRAAERQVQTHADKLTAHH